MEAGGSILAYIDLTMCVGKLLSLTLNAALQSQILTSCVNLKRLYRINDSFD